MATFRYTAKSRDGARQEGTLDAADKRSAMALLSRRGLVPISIRDDAGGGNSARSDAGVDDEAGGGDDGCSAAPGSSVGFLGLLPFLGLLAARRRK